MTNKKKHGNIKSVVEGFTTIEDCVTVATWLVFVIELKSIVKIENRIIIRVKSA